MKKKFLLCFVVLFFVLNGIVHAKKQRQHKYATLVEAYTQQTIPGMRRTPRPPPVTHFIVVWENKQHPDAFFWRADTVLLSCNVVKVHKISDRAPKGPVWTEYYSENITMNNINKGDTLDVVPMKNIKGVLADGVSNVPDTTNTLLFEMSGKHGVELNWLHVDVITKKHDIAMP